MSLLQNRFEQMASSIRNSAELMAKIGQWLGNSPGRIINFTTESESVHLIFTKQKVVSRAGNYPSCEAYYMGAESALMKVLAGELNAYDGVRTGELRVWGNLNEATEFEMLLRPKAKLH